MIRRGVEYLESSDERLWSRRRTGSQATLGIRHVKREQKNFRDKKKKGGGDTTQSLSLSHLVRRRRREGVA